MGAPFLRSKSGVSRKARPYQNSGASRNEDAFGSVLRGSHPITMSDTHAAFDLRTLPKSDTYKLLASTILPRPIAWITTLDEDGKPNAAPFSFFNVVSADPPLIVVGFSAAPDRDGKDTLSNIRRTGELVVNLVPEELAEAMNV